MDFMTIVALDAPDFRTISEFRRRHLTALAALFVQVLKLAEQAGLVKLGHVALDGTKIKANASKHKAMSYERMKKREAELKAEVDRWLKAAEAADAQEDKLYGDRRGDEMPDWVADKQKRLAKIGAAKAELEAEAKAAAEEEARRRKKQRTSASEGRKKTGRRRRPQAEPDGKAQRNFTDPESRILKTKDGYIQGYNAQAAVDGGRRSSWRRRSPTAAAIRRNSLRCSTPSEPISGAIRTKYRPMQATARPPIFARSGGGGSTATSRPDDRSTAASPPPPEAVRTRLAPRQDERQAQARRPSQPLPVAKADRRAGVRTDQAGERVPPVPVARHREGEGRMGDDLHRPQPRQARAGRMSTIICRMSTSSLVKNPNVRPTWTGSEVVRH